MTDSSQEHGAHYADAELFSPDRRTDECAVSTPLAGLDTSTCGEFVCPDQRTGELSVSGMLAGLDTLI
eukprot:scaffold29624_cov30-Tisochrysis_lutea.AAC.2